MRYDIERLTEHRRRYLKAFENVGFLGTENCLPRKSCGISQSIERISFDEEIANSPDSPTEIVHDSELLSELLAHHPEQKRVFLTGDGGIGKTELTRFLALGLAEGLDPSSLRPLVPVWFELKALRNTDANLFDRLTHDDAAWLMPLALGGRIIFILDGLDEVSASRNYFEDDLKRLVTKFENCSFVLAGRPGSLGSLDAGGLFSRERHYVLQSPSINDVEEYALAYFEHLGDIKRGQRLYDAIRRSDGAVRKLLRHPFVLAVACQVFESTAQNIRLPDNPAELIEKCLCDLIQRRRYNPSRNPHGVLTMATDTCLDFLSTLAAHCVVNPEQRLTFPSARGKAVLQERNGLTSGEAENSLAQLAPESGILIRTSDDCYSFTNRVVAEYLAIRWIAVHGRPDRCQFLTTPIDNHDEIEHSIITFYSDFVWSHQQRNLLQLLCYILATRRPQVLIKIGKLLGSVKTYDDLCRTLNTRYEDLLSTISPESPAWNEPDRELLFVRQEPPVPARTLTKLEIAGKEPTNAKVALGEIEAGNILCEKMRLAKGTYDVVNFAEELSNRRAGDPKACQILCERLSTAEDGIVINSLVTALARGWKGNGNARKSLCEKLSLCENPRVICDLATALAEIWTGETETIAALRSKLAVTADGPAAWRLTGALAIIGAEDEMMAAHRLVDTLDGIKDEGDIASLAETLVRGWAGDARTGRALSAKLRVAKNPHAIDGLAKALAEGWAGDVDARAAICEKLIAAEGRHLIMNLAEELANGWAGDAIAGKAICGRLNSDADLVDRLANALAMGWAGDADVGNALRKRLRATNSEYTVRVLAFPILNGWAGDPEFGQALSEKLEVAEEAETISRILQMLVRGWNRDPAVSKAIREKLSATEDIESYRELIDALADCWAGDPESVALVFRLGNAQELTEQQEYLFIPGVFEELDARRQRYGWMEGFSLIDVDEEDSLDTTSERRARRRAVLMAPRERVRNGLGLTLLGMPTVKAPEIPSIPPLLAGEESREEPEATNRAFRTGGLPPKAVTGGKESVHRVAEASPSQEERKKRKCRLRVDSATRNIYVDGRPIPHTSGMACEILQRLIDADGGIMPPEKLILDDQAKAGEIKERVKDAIEKLDQDVRRFLGGKSGQGGGRFLKEEAFTPQ